MASIVEAAYDPSLDLTAVLSARSCTSGIPAVSGYEMLEIEPGVYRFTVPERLFGEFNLDLLNASSEHLLRLYVTFDGEDGTFTATESATTAPGPSYSPGSEPPSQGVGLVKGLSCGLTDQLSRIVEPEVTSILGCTDPGQQPAYVLPAGDSVGMYWDLRDSNNDVVVAEYPDPAEPVDIESDLTCPPYRAALLNNPFCANKVYTAKLQIRGGRVVIIPPPQILKSPAIYNLMVMWRTSAGDFGGQSLVSVEQTLYNRAISSTSHGPLELSRIRGKLRDYAALNDIHGFPEFSTAEVLNAILEPVMYYNELPPFVRAYSVSDFPYRVQWLDATVSRLLQTAGLWMQRNQVSLNAEGVTSDDRSKFTAILRYSAALWDKYESFVRSDKMRQNIQNGFKIMG